MTARNSPRALALAVALALVAGCAPARMYHWSSYDQSLYRHYKNPADREAWVEALRTTILEAEQRGLRVPPGVHAEYGYALYEEGRMDEAITYFKLERDQWPESRVFMEKMIRNSEQRAGRPATRPALAPAATHGPAGALEKTP